MKANANRKKPAFLLVSILVVVLSTICIWLLDSNGGRTKIQRMTVPAGNGNSMSYVAFIPDNATVETPAPAFVIWPGRIAAGCQGDCRCYCRHKFHVHFIRFLSVRNFPDTTVCHSGDEPCHR